MFVITGDGGGDGAGEGFAGGVLGGGGGTEDEIAGLIRCGVG